ncbi:unnamed protein product [Polarella glacialis]|uniref:Uncharacterized protein n=1 Tax=Polarella glacialis TaxID=89957 RepID=A0A813K6L0_POLGL|nr:unnamed protein product [Polarella glacialis]
MLAGHAGYPQPNPDLAADSSVGKGRSHDLCVTMQSLRLPGDKEPEDMCRIGTNPGEMNSVSAKGELGKQRSESENGAEGRSLQKGSDIEPAWCSSRNRHPCWSHEQWAECIPLGGSASDTSSDDESSEESWKGHPPLAQGLYRAEGEAGGPCHIVDVTLGRNLCS